MGLQQVLVSIIIMASINVCTGNLSAVTDVVVTQQIQLPENTGHIAEISWNEPKRLANETILIGLTYSLDYCVNQTEEECVNGSLTTNTHQIISKLKENVTYTYFIHVFDENNNKGPIYIGHFHVKEKVLSPPSLTLSVRPNYVITRFYEISTLQQNSKSIKGYELKVYQLQNRSSFVTKFLQHQGIHNGAREVRFVGLLGDAVYVIKIRIVFVDGATSRWSDGNAFTPLLGIPGDVDKVVTSPVKLSESSSVTLSWDVPKELNGHAPTSLSYQVNYCQLNFPSTCFTLPRVKTRSITIAALKADNYYQYKIYVYDEFNKTGPFPYAHYFKTARQNTCLPNYFRCTLSNQCVLISRTCNGIQDCGDGSDERLDAKCLTPRYAPSQLKILAITPFNVTLQWRTVPPSDRPLLYNIIVRGPNTESTVKLNAGFGQVVLEKQLAGLLPNREYKIRIRAVNPVGNGDFSEQISVTTEKITDLPILTLPKTATITPVVYHESTKVVLNWLPPIHLHGNNVNMISYQVNYCTINMKCSTHTEKIKDTQITLENLIPHHIYQYRIRVFNENEESDDNNSTYTHIFKMAKRDSCHSDYFACYQTEQCVLHTRLCDGIINCRDRSDESQQAGCSLPRFNVQTIDIHRTNDRSLTIRFEPKRDASQRIKAYEIENINTEQIQLFRHTHLSVEKTIDAMFIGLKPATEYGFRIRAINPTGKGEWSKPYKALTPGSRAIKIPTSTSTSTKTPPTTNARKPPQPLPTQIKDPEIADISEMSLPQKIGVAVGIVLAVILIIISVILLNRYKVKHRKLPTKLFTNHNLGVFNPNYDIVEGRV